MRVTIACFLEELKNASLNRYSLREPACLFAQNKAVALDQCSNLQVHHAPLNSVLQPNSPSPLQEADWAALGIAIAQASCSAQTIAFLVSITPLTCYN